jgi:hypothetical protein
MLCGHRFTGRKAHQYNGRCNADKQEEISARRPCYRAGYSVAHRHLQTHYAIIVRHRQMHWRHRQTHHEHTCDSDARSPRRRLLHDKVCVQGTTGSRRMTGRFNGRQYNIIIYIMLYCLLAKLKQVALYFHCKSLETPGWGLGAPSVELGHEQSQRQVEFGPGIVGFSFRLLKEIDPNYDAALHVFELNCANGDRWHLHFHQRGNCNRRYLPFEATQPSQ